MTPPKQRETPAPSTRVLVCTRTEAVYDQCCRLFTPPAYLIARAFMLDTPTIAEIDVLIVDRDLAGESVASFVATVRDVVADAIIVVLSPTVEEQARIVHAGADVYLTPPVDDALLVAWVAASAQQQHAVRSTRAAHPSAASTASAGKRHTPANLRELEAALDRLCAKVNRPGEPPLLTKSSDVTGEVSYTLAPAEDEST